MTLITFIIPTRDRHDELVHSLASLGALSTPCQSAINIRDCELIIADNASVVPVSTPKTLENGMPVRVLRLPVNIGAAARNKAASEARGEWLVMLDDDSAPADAALLTLLPRVSDEIVGLCADIRIPHRGRESGGLPEVPIGCGFAVRRDAFCAVGGYDPSYVFYAEEYDLAAKLIRRFAESPGPVIAHEPAFRVTHHKTRTHRSMNTILHNLVRNNAWTIQRYTPDACLDAALNHTLNRYHDIARKENAMDGYESGRRDLEETLADQPRTPLPQHLYDRFTGLAAARAHLHAAHTHSSFKTAHIVDPGKNEWAIRQALSEFGVAIVDHDADVHVIGTLSPGPLLDAFEHIKHTNGTTKIVHMPWDPRIKLSYAPPDATLAV